MSLRPFFSLATMLLIVGFNAACTPPAAPPADQVPGGAAETLPDAAVEDEAAGANAVPKPEDPTDGPAEPGGGATAVTGETPPVAAQPAAVPADGDGGGDYTQWLRSGHKNNVVDAPGIPIDWDIGGFDRQTGEWLRERSRNIKWVARLGSQSYGNPIIADGKVFVGTNNSAGYLERFPADVDLGCLIAFRESDGEFLWQHSSRKLPTGRVNDWPMQGICSAPYVEGKRLWFVTSRGEVVCLDTEGFHDGVNDGPFTGEEVVALDEADVIWVYDMMQEQNVFQHNMCSCSITALGDVLFVITGNGVDETHIKIPAPEAPSFMAMDKNTGEVYWTDNSPGMNILHGQWSSPAVAEIDGVPQVLFAGGDGWLYSFRADKGVDGKPELLWKFDCNPKDSEWILSGRGTRNELIATPVVYDGLVYIAVGQDPEHGEGIGHLWCIDPTRRGDVSAELVVHKDDPTTVLPHRRLLAVDPAKGETTIPNPNSAVVWHYDHYDLNGDGQITFEETMHRTIGTVAIKNDLLFIADFSGLFHCLNAKTGQLYWTYDLLAATWGSPLICGDYVYIGDEDGDVTIFRLTSEPHEPVAEINMGNSVYTSPVVANGVLYIANRTHLFAIAHDSAEAAE